MLYVVLFATMILFAVLGIKLTKQFFNPLTIFNSIWFIVLLLYQMRLSQLQVELSADTIILFIFCMLSFSLAYLFIYSCKFRKISTKENNKIISYRVIRNLFIFWIFVEIIETIYSGGIPVVWTLMGSSKTYFDYGIASVHGFMNAIGLVIITVAYYLYEFQKKENQKKDKRLLYIIGFMMIFYLALITRQVVISMLLQMLFVKLQFIEKIPWKKLLILGIIVVIAFGLIGNFRTGYEGFLRVAVLKNSHPNKFLIGIYWVYMYLTMTVANINNAVSLGVSGYGITPIAKTFIPTVISNIIFSNNVVEIPNYLVTQAFTVSGFFIHFYIGYGLLGVVFIAGIYRNTKWYLFEKIM